MNSTIGNIESVCVDQYDVEGRKQQVRRYVHRGKTALHKVYLMTLETRQKHHLLCLVKDRGATSIYIPYSMDEHPIPVSSDDCANLGAILDSLKKFSPLSA